MVLSREVVKDDVWNGKAEAEQSRVIQNSTTVAPAGHLRLRAGQI